MRGRFFFGASAKGGATTDEGEEEATGDAAAGEGLDSSVDTVLGARICEGGAVPFEGWAAQDMNCTDPEANDFASGFDSGFKSILRLNTEGWGVSLARSNKASATSTSSETVGGDTLSSLEALGFGPLGFILLLGFRVTADDNERVLDGAGVGEATGGGG